MAIGFSPSTAIGSPHRRPSLHLANRAVQTPVEDDHRETVGPALGKAKRAAAGQRQLQLGGVLPRSYGVSDGGGHGGISSRLDGAVHSSAQREPHAKLDPTLAELSSQRAISVWFGALVEPSLLRARCGTTRTRPLAVEDPGPRYALPWAGLARVDA